MYTIWNCDETHDQHSGMGSYMLVENGQNLNCCCPLCCRSGQSQLQRTSPPPVWLAEGYSAPKIHTTNRNDQEPRSLSRNEKASNNTPCRSPTMILNSVRNLLRRWPLLLPASRRTASSEAAGRVRDGITRARNCPWASFEFSLGL